MREPLGSGSTYVSAVVGQISRIGRGVHPRKYGNALKFENYLSSLLSRIDLETGHIGMFWFARLRPFFFQFYVKFGLGFRSSQRAGEPLLHDIRKLMPIIEHARFRVIRLPMLNQLLQNLGLLVRLVVNFPRVGGKIVQLPSLLSSRGWHP